MLVNPEVPLEALLPPSGVAEGAFLIMAKDWKEWNTGTWLARVNERSVAFFDEVLSYQHHIPPLWIAEQSAIVLLAEKYQLEQKGEMVSITQQLLNSYDGPKAYQNPRDAFIIHWPSLHFKRAEMLPFLRKLTKGEIEQDPNKFAESKAEFIGKVKDFWEAYARGQ